jgi:radical SAM family uncharacterized protein
MLVELDDEVLSSVEKPARYTGNEWNIVRKNPSEVSIRFAFCFPDLYEVGMSHLGMRILYHLLNSRTDAYCERVFAPWPDMESVMRNKNIPLYSLETYDAIRDFDFIGFTLQYEMSYTNILNMLDLAGVPLQSRDRGDKDPFVCAGGPCAYNPEPLADFIDFFILGEGEEVINEVLDLYQVWKKLGKPRTDFLEKISTVEGVYIPSFYNVEYNSDGTVAAIKSKGNCYPDMVKKRIIRDIDKVVFPDNIIVPYIDIVHDRIMLEIFRGCSHGCRFCQAGFVYRPVREKEASTLLEHARKLIESTGYSEISLSSLSTSDYSQIKELTDGLIEMTENKKMNLSLPSMRIDSFTLDLMEKAQKVRKGGLTFAPEAATQRLRDVINKGVTEENLMESVRIAFQGGWENLKLYFMIGLPEEEMSDVKAIAELGFKVLDEYAQLHGGRISRNLNVTISTSAFVPKPFTPFQWEAQDSIETINEKQTYLKENTRSRHLKYNWSDAELSHLEAVFARGDRRLSRVLEIAWKMGCKFDGWREYFDYSRWREAFKLAGLEPEFYANRKREYNEVLPWDHIDVGVRKNYLIEESKRAHRGETSPGCGEACSGCGISSFNAGICP